MKNLKKLVVIGAILGATHGAKAFEKEFEPAKNGENQGIELINGQLMVKTEGGKVADVDMPYTFVGTNTTNFAQSGFAVQEMADANSILLDNNDVYFTRSSTNGVYKMTVSDRTALNGISGQLEFFESAEPVKVLSVKDGVIYTQNTNNNQVVELGNVATASESNITVPENLTNTLHSVGKDGIYVVTDNFVDCYDKDGKFTKQKVTGIGERGHTPKDVVAFDEDTIFILDTEGNLYHNSGALFNNMTSVSNITRSKDGKSLLITSTNSNGKTVVSSYNPETKETTNVYTEPADKKKPFANQKVSSANGIKYFVRNKSIGYE